MDDNKEWTVNRQQRGEWDIWAGKCLWCQQETTEFSLDSSCMTLHYMKSEGVLMLVCGTCVLTRLWSTLKKAIWQGLLSRLAKAIKASAVSKFRISTAAMKDIPCTYTVTNHDQAVPITQQFVKLTLLVSYGVRGCKGAKREMTCWKELLYHWHLHKWNDRVEQILSGC